MTSRAVHRGDEGPTGVVVEVTPESAGWTYASLVVVDLEPGARWPVETGESEWIVLPLSGRCSVSCDGASIDLQGRGSVFTRVSDFAYVPRDAHAEVHAPDGGRFALCGARAERRLDFRYGPAADVPVEIRGAGSMSRQVNNFASPDAFVTDRLIAVEVLTPGGNWSSYPPHKHDEARSGEAILEEIYYFEIDDHGHAPGPGAYQRVYGADPARPISVLEEVHSGDVVLIPYGYHGPTMAAPGYDAYFLNVLAGPGEVRTMAFCDDPAHAWIRASWAGQGVDPRLPMTSTEEDA